MVIEIDQDIYLSEVSQYDKYALVEFLNDKDIYDHTLLIPYPYRMKDAESWLQDVIQEERLKGRQTFWAIRSQQENGKLIGGLGMHCKYGRKSHKDEIGYWLAKPYWGQGIMTAVVEKFCDYAFLNLDLIRVEAPVFIFNKGSARVLEKAGFEMEGVMRKCYMKDDQIFDGKLYAKVRW